ncbi:MAG TPA: DUF1465 family protein [Stellaceae bacterium]|nr:DUF1465 family protein [Stellaceae bacterium]
MPNVSNAIINRLHDEAFALLLTSRDWAGKSAYAIRSVEDPMQSLSIAAAAMGLTALVTDSLAWIMAQRAFAAGEITEREALSERFAPAQLALDGFAPDLLPAKLAELIQKAERFHQRITLLHSRRQQYLLSA